MIFTKPAVDVFAPTTAGGAPRGAVMGEAQTWGVEVERGLAELESVITAYPGKAIVLAFSGQSNMANVHSYSWAPEPNLFYSNATWEGVATGFGPVPGTSMGMAYSIANEVAKRNPTRPVWMVNVSRSSTGIANWLPGAPVFDVYGAFTAAVDQLLTYLDVEKVDQFFWWQGESDAFDGSDTYPADFETLHNRLIAETWFDEATPITIMAVSTHYDGGNGPILRSFNGQLRQIVHMRPATRRFCDTSLLPDTYWGDADLHMTAEGYEKAGRLAALVACDGIGQGSAVEYVARKPAQEVRQNSAVAFQDLDLKVFVRTGRSYSIEIYVAALMEAASDFKYSITGPSASIRQGHVETRDPELDAPLTTKFAGGYPTNVTVATADYGAFELVIRLTVVNPTENGFIKFCWSQATATSDVTRVWGSSYLKMIEALV